jgi:hypothetical protein
LNLSTLKKSRRRLKAGDIFVMAPSDGKFLFGRVINTNADPLGVGGAILIYIYRARSEGKLQVPDLTPETLLVPPIMTNTLPWSRGYFEVIENRPLVPSDCLKRHTFLRDWTKPPQYFDEQGNRVQGPPKGPVGTWGLWGFEAIDSEISKALGLSAGKG